MFHICYKSFILGYAVAIVGISVSTIYSIFVNEKYIHKVF